MARSQTSRGPCACRWCQFSICLMTSLLVSGSLVAVVESLRPEGDCECVAAVLEPILEPILEPEISLSAACPPATTQRRRSSGTPSETDSG